jgi:hypothetical protein
VPREHAIGESLVVTKIEISLRTIVKNVDFSVLGGIHCPGIHIEIRIKLLKYHTQLAGFKQCSQ